MKISVMDEEFLLHPERLLIWPDQQMLIAADLHLGKAQSFRRHGLWLPDEAHESDLIRLSKVIEAFRLRHIVFLGDFVHAREGVTPELIDYFSQWWSSFKEKLLITVVIGNHDRGTVKQWPASWAHIELTEALSLKGCRFQHDPPSKIDLESREYIWSGHIHPKLLLKVGPDQMRLPVFVVGPQYSYLPAFSSLAGGYNVESKKGERYFVVADSEVIEVNPKL